MFICCLSSEKIEQKPPPTCLPDRQAFTDNGPAPIVNSSVFITNSTGATKWLNVAGTANTTTVSAVWGSALPDGDYLMKVVVYDGAANTAQALTNFTMDATAPVITIASPAAGLYTKLNNFTASWSITDGAGSGLAGQKSWARLVNVSGSYNYSWVVVTGKSTMDNQLQHEDIACGRDLAATDGRHRCRG